MSAPFSWIKPHPWGVEVVPAGAFIDPSRAVDKALVTHGHADHARGGHGETIATPETLAIMELRYRTGAADDAGDGGDGEHDGHSENAVADRAIAGHGVDDGSRVAFKRMNGPIGGHESLQVRLENTASH